MISPRLPRSFIINVGTYKRPMLMATATPIFSAGFICNFQTRVQGNSARLRSIVAEYTDSVMVSHAEDRELGPRADSPAEKMSKLTMIF